MQCEKWFISGVRKSPHFTFTIHLGGVKMSKTKVKALNHRAELALEGYKTFMMSKGLVKDNEALTFKEANVKDTWKSVIQVYKDGTVFPNAQRYYSVSAVPHGSRGYTLKSFNHTV